jgi:hypothetical protein
MGQVFSQNGWPAHADTSRFVRASARGFGFWAANADVAVVFTEFINRFDTEVEEITQPLLDDWSYANRLVRGSTTSVSNHGSATAIDLNAVKHSRGVRNTFSSAKAGKMREIRNSITDARGVPVLRLGMDFTTTVDDMHIEINASAMKVKEAANKIRARNALALEDIVATKAELEALLNKYFIDKKFIPNKVLDTGTVQGDDWTLPGVLAASDQKSDLIRREQAAQGRAQQSQAEAISFLTTQVSGKASEASVRRLEIKVDALIALLKPKPPAT